MLLCRLLPDGGRVPGAPAFLLPVLGQHPCRRIRDGGGLPARLTRYAPGGSFLVALAWLGKTWVGDRDAALGAHLGMPFHASKSPGPHVGRRAPPCDSACLLRLAPWWLAWSREEAEQPQRGPTSLLLHASLASICGCEGKLYIFFLQCFYPLP